ncbi:MAG: YkgJ family cysteine cluster protein [Candidatus Methanoperedens sp.]|nr:YkgJ family cysteine cluster protein [Candidatus Methanoperedens sp.]MCE8424935.1 YkgJ family cysteine cluster protein [Candidatus Methanoperedens sp.]MCE8427461.1 YkgJ family cysteine cluster protein [Candidatus Methanoperedens sp.]
MDIASIRRRIEYLIQVDSSLYASALLNSGCSCARCGWCCRYNFDIRITKDISRPSNAISIFPEDIRRIIKGTGNEWNKIALPDIYSCLSDGDNIWVIGWILKRNDAGDCVFYRGGSCAIYKYRPMICRCYPFFMDEKGLDIMHCEGGKDKIAEEIADQAGLLLKRYEIKKLQSYISILSQLKDKLDIANLCSLPEDYSGNFLVCDNEGISLRRLL